MWSEFPERTWSDFSEPAGADFNHMYRRTAVYVDKILKGFRPAELPVERASKYYLVINRATANTIGVTIPQSILARTDEVIG